MSMSSNVVLVQKFITNCFDQDQPWVIRELAVSSEGWSMQITHFDKDWTWEVQGDADNILLRTLEGGRSMSLSVYTGPCGENVCAELWAAQPLNQPHMWGWVRGYEEDDFTEV